MSTNMTARGFLLTSVGAAALLVASAASAQPSRPVRTLTEPAYRELRQLAQQLDVRAQHAGDQAEHDQFRMYRRDNTFARLVSSFARQASQFNARMANYRARPWALDEDLRNLLRSAREVQTRVRQSRHVDEHTLGDWNEIVEILNRMVRVGDGRIDFREFPGLDPRERPAPPPDHRRDEYGSRNQSGSADSRGDQLAGLARELEDRAGRALESAQRAIAENGPYRREFMQSIRDFNRQVAAFRQSIGSGTNNPGQLRAEASRLLDVARQNDQRMRQNNAFREVWPDWQGAIQTLQRILDLLR